MFCPKCGARNEDGRQFCENCGAALTPPSAPPGAGQAPAGYGYGGQQPNYGAAPGGGQPGQAPAGYGYGGQQPNYGAGQTGQAPAGYGYGGQQPNYGAGQTGQAPAGYNYGGQQPNYGAGQTGQGPTGYNYGGQQANYGSAQVATQKKNMLPIIIAIAAVAVIAIVVVVVFVMRGGGDLVGTWSYEQDGMTILMTFKKDGSGTMEAKGFGGLSLSFEWKDLGGDKIEMTLMGEKAVMKYSINGDTLTMTEEGTGEVQKFTREK